jgi:hypothetical protein
VSRRARRILIGLGLVLALGLVVGGVSANRAADDDGQATTAESSIDTSPPLSTLPTPEAVQTQVFERALSECASYDVARLAGKYNVAVITEQNVAQAVAEAWVRQFKAGRDALTDGRDGCLQGFSRG